MDDQREESQGQRVPRRSSDAFPALALARFCASTHLGAASNMHTLHLNNPQDWEWRKSPCKALTPPSEVLSSKLLDNNDWTTCTQMERGSQIQVELLAAGRIPDPFLGRNEEVESLQLRAHDAR